MDYSSYMALFRELLQSGMCLLPIGSQIVFEYRRAAVTVKEYLQQFTTQKSQSQQTASSSLDSSSIHYRTLKGLGRPPWKAY